MDDRRGGEGPFLGGPMAPVRATLVRAPKTPFPTLFGRAISVAFRSPVLGLGLGGAILLSRAGWAVSLLLVLQALFGESALPLAAAVGLGLTATLFAAVVELAIWAGGIPVLAGRMRGEASRRFGPLFARGLEAVFATMLGLGLFRVLAWILFQLAGVGMLIAFLAALIASPALVVFGIPLILLYVAGELLWRIFAWIAIARAGALEEGLLPALFAAIRQFFARPMAHLLTWWAANFAISVAGGGVAALVAAGLGAMPTLGAALLALVTSLFVGMVLLAAMAVYTALSLDATPPRPARAAPSPQLS